MVNSEEAKNGWLQTHSDLAAILITVAGGVARLWAASGTFLNPDEALHFRLANQSSLAAAYRASLTTSHPPLLLLLLHLWRGLGTSDLWLRLPSVLAGTIFCWLFFKWLTGAAGRLAGLIGLIFVALLPPQIMVSAEVRQYALLLAFLAAALYFLDRAFAEDSAGLMFTSMLCLYFAMLTHYSAFLFAGGLGFYALSKIFVPRPLRPHGAVIASWVVGQLGGLALCLFLYKTHLSRLDFRDSEGWMTYISRSSFFRSGHDNPVLFVIGHSFGVFQYQFGQLAVGIAMGLAFLAGLWFILRGRRTTEATPPSRRLAILLILPFVLACGSSFLHIYPYGGTRHASFLAIPAMAGVSIAMAGLSAKSWPRGVAVAVLVVMACLAFGKPRQPWIDRADQSSVHMTDAMRFVQNNINRSDLIFTDYQSGLILGHYLCGRRPISMEPAPPEFEQFCCGEHRVVSRDYRGWDMGADSFPQQWQRLAQDYNLKPGDKVWVFQAGWGIDLPENLRRRYSEFQDLSFESFGNNIKIFEMRVGRPMPVVPLLNSK